MGTRRRCDDRVASHPAGALGQCYLGGAAEELPRTADGPGGKSGLEQGYREAQFHCGALLYLHVPPGGGAASNLRGPVSRGTWST